jgi:sacsin
MRPHPGSAGSEDRRRGPALPTPGSFIPIEEHHLLKEDITDFESGEYVGYELDGNETTENEETTIVYAIVIKPISINDDADVDASANVTGNVEESSPSAKRPQRFSKRYLLNVGDDRRPIVVPTTSIYKFHRVEALMSSFQTGSASKSEGVHSAENSESNISSNGNLNSAVSRWEKAHNVQLSATANGHSKSALQNGHCATSKETSLVNSSSFTQPKSDKVQQNSVNVSAENELIKNRLSSTLAEITDALTEAWQLPLAERRKVIRRLLLRWHPDKNIGDEQLATSVTQHIHAEIERLETAASFPWNDDPNYGADPRNPFADSDSFRRNFAEAYRFFFEQMKERGREQRAQRERYRDHYAREFPGASSYGSRWFESSSSAASAASDSSADGSFETTVPPPTFASCNPQPAQARRFLRQAREDLRSSDHDLKAEEPSFEWVCFKARQVN